MAVVMKWSAAGSVVLLVALAAGCAAGNDPAARRARLEAIRHTAAVEVYQDGKGSVVNIGVHRPDPSKQGVMIIEYGSGVVLHEAGYILTNSHALRHGGMCGVGFHQGKEFPARIVAVDEQRDLAVLKIEPDRPLRPVPLGHSRDLLVGEQIITMGNPFGMGLTVTYGIVSALNRSTKSDYTFFPNMIQTSASINPGSSGGPLLNVFGELVGINATARLGANDIGFAIPVDRIREAMPEVLDPEGRFGYRLGLRVETDGPARVAAVEKGSPADAAGVRAGDVVIRAAKTTVLSGVDFYLALLDCRGGQRLPLSLLRQGKVIEVTATPAQVEPRPPDGAVSPAPGLVCDYFEGQWEALPDFASLKAAASGRADTFDLGKYKGRDFFGLRFTGYVDVPADGIWAFYLASDDGSRLYVGDRLVVDNDGLHAMTEKRGFIPLKAGKHAITVLCFERTGEEGLRVSWEGPKVKKQPIPATALFARGAAK
jgi:S1-C subfamily serine protease